ncbi:MAG TPA: hypothetical protein VKK79_07075 [Candidatus Lokiarchaeia archaeon]|nr:hypothetical protein [Candidatus Lokiarchaeia archaeon]
MPFRISPSDEARTVFQSLPNGTMLMIHGTVAEANVSYTMSCRGINPDQMGVKITSELHDDDCLQSDPNLPFFLDTLVWNNLESDGKELSVVFLPAEDEEIRFLAIIK